MNNSVLIRRISKVLMKRDRLSVSTGAGEFNKRRGERSKKGWSIEGWTKLCPRNAVKSFAYVLFYNKKIILSTCSVIFHSCGVK